MSQENVDIVRRSYAAFERGDLAAVADDHDPDLVTHRPDPDGGTWHGQAGFLQMLADWTEGLDQLTASPEEFIDAGNRVVVRVRQRARGQISGAPVEEVFWFVHTLRNRNGWTCSPSRPRPSKPPGCRSSQALPLRTKSGSALRPRPPSQL
jgi:ketosteroid isomerase-like protein